LRVALGPVAHDLRERPILPVATTAVLALQLGRQQRVGARNSVRSDFGSAHRRELTQWRGTAAPLRLRASRAPPPRGARGARPPPRPRAPGPTRSARAATSRSPPRTR